MPKTRSSKWKAVVPGLAMLLALAACGAPSVGNEDASDRTSGVTINVVLAAEPPPQALLDEFTQDTGITVNWVNIDWDSLQTKISAAPPPTPTSPTRRTSTGRGWGSWASSAGSSRWKTSSTPGR